MKMAKRIVSVFVAAYIVFAGSTALFAKETTTSISPNYGKRGSVIVDMHSTDTGEALSGGTLILYKVAVFRQSNGSDSLEVLEEFKGSGIHPDDLKEKDSVKMELASKLENYVQDRSLSGSAAALNDNGQAEWKTLELGIYLVVNTVPIKGYEPVNSFLVTVPELFDGNYVYDIQASPKAEPALGEEGHPDSGISDTTEKTPEAACGYAVIDNKLPQTGQLWWPVPMLVIGGFVFIISGWNINSGVPRGRRGQ